MPHVPAKTPVWFILLEPQASPNPSSLVFPASGQLRMQVNLLSMLP